MICVTIIITESIKKVQSFFVVNGNDWILTKADTSISQCWLNEDKTYENAVKWCHYKVCSLLYCQIQVLSRILEKQLLSTQKASVQFNISVIFLLLLQRLNQTVHQQISLCCDSFTAPMSKMETLKQQDKCLTNDSLVFEVAAVILINFLRADWWLSWLFFGSKADWKHTWKSVFSFIYVCLKT